MLDERQLWIEYKRSGNLKIREQLVVKYIPLVKYVVGKMITNLPKSVEYDDLVEYGIIGLLDAVEKFDLNKEITFKTYAVTRVRGSIYDELRSQDWVPRSVRKMVKDVEKAYPNYDTEEKQYIVGLDFTKSGAEKFSAATKKLSVKQEQLMQRQLSFQHWNC